jgi:hypothetical protein
MNKKTPKRRRGKEIEITIRVRVDEDWSLEELERLIDEAGDCAKREALTDALQDEEPEKPQECHVCGRQGVLYGRGHGPLRFDTVFGPIALRQPRYRCPNCGAEYYPVEEDLGLIRPGPVSPGVYRLAVWEGISRSYEQAALHLAEVSRERIRLTAKDIHALVQQAGAAHLRQRAEEVAVLWEEPQQARPLSRPRPGELFCVQADGGWVPGREVPKEHIEGKVVKMWWDRCRKKQGGRGIITEKSYVATFAGAHAVGREAVAVSIAMGVDERTHVLFLADGDKALRETVWRVYFPWAQYRLDWRHLRNYVWRAVAQMWLDAGPQKATGRQWVQWLWDGARDKMRAAVGQVSGLVGEAEKARRNLLQYLDDNWEGIGCYRLWWLQDEIISSSVIEKAVDEVIVRRQKKQGMVWSRAGANVVAALRALWASGRKYWDQFWRGQPILVQSNACLHA